MKWKNLIKETQTVHQRFYSINKTMLLYCLKYKKNTESKKYRKLQERKTRHTKKLKFIKEQEARELLRSLGIKTPLSKIPLLSPLLF